MKLRVGKIPYLNLMPIFYMLKQHCDCSAYEFIEGYPAKLNEMLRAGNLDVSPSSSVEYLRREMDYDIIDGHSISSRGQVESILLFSRLPLNALDGKEIFVTHQSATSAALMEVIIRKFLQINCTLKVSSLPAGEALKAHSAYLAIGDDALRSARNARNIIEECPETGCSFLRFGLFQYFVYDLGAIWQEHTGLPFVYALWIYKKSLPDEKKHLMRKLKDDLDTAKTEAVKKFPELSRIAESIMPPEDLVRYWEKISYDLGEDHRKGLALFRDYLDELGLLKSE